MYALWSDHHILVSGSLVVTGEASSNELENPEKFWILICFDGGGLFYAFHFICFTFSKKLPIKSQIILHLILRNTNFKLKPLLWNMRTQNCEWFCCIENQLKLWCQRSKIWSSRFTTYHLPGILEHYHSQSLNYQSYIAMPVSKNKVRSWKQAT